MGSKLSSYNKNNENPFLEEAVARIQKNIVKKYRNSSGTSKTAILQAISSDGELMGHTSFVRQIEVDEQQFTKFYLSQFSAFFNLKTQAYKVFGYIMTKLMPKQDMFIFLMSECIDYTGYKGEGSIFIGLGSLVESKIIARGPSDSLYFINPMIVFNGDRVTFARTYVKKQNKKKVDNPNQLSIFDDPNYKEKEEGWKAKK